MSSESTDVERALHALAETLEAQGVAWYLFGAQAVVVYGRPRATADIDVTVDFELDRWHELAERLAERGFFPRMDDPGPLVRRTRVLPLVFETTGVPVDLVLAGPVGLEQRFLSRPRTVDLAGVPVRIIAPEDLLVSKILAGRPKDLEDVRGILAERGDRLDLRQVRDLLVALEAALDRADLVAELDRLVGRR